MSKCRRKRERRDQGPGAFFIAATLRGIRHAVTLRQQLPVVRRRDRCAAVDHILAAHHRLDVVVNNAGMLMAGLTEAFSAEQVARIIDTNAISWLRVNRVALPSMRRQGNGLLMYVGSTTSQLHEPFIGPYVASKAAGDALAEIMGMEIRPFGIDSVILVPGAFTSGTEHFAELPAPAYPAITQQYGELAKRIETLGDRLHAIDIANGGPLDVSAVGLAAVEVLAMPPGRRPLRMFIDGQRKGTEAIEEISHEKQDSFLRKMGLEDLAFPAPLTKD
nr:SDR family NAD(P)-dependent oxidoreductase [Herbaspirillum lusitanum]